MWNEILLEMNMHVNSGKPLDIIFDIDGTIVEKEKQLRDILKKQFYRISLYCGISVVTGRSFLESDSICRDMHINRPAIFCDGNMIYDINTSRILFENCIDTTNIFPIITSIQQYAYLFYEYCDTVYVCSVLDAGIYSSTFGVQRKKIKVCSMIPRHVHRIHLRWFTSNSLLSAKSILDDIKEKNLSIFSRSDLWYFIEKKADKVEGFKVLESLGYFKAENTAFFGNGKNDARLMRYIRWGVAVNNAEPEAKANARCVLVKDGVDGVSDVLIELADQLCLFQLQKEGF